MHGHSVVDRMFNSDGVHYSSVQKFKERKLLHRQQLTLLITVLSVFSASPAKPMTSCRKPTFSYQQVLAGGWDGTARGVGEALQKSGLVRNVSFENLSGGGGGRAIAKLIETKDRQQNTLMINSTPIVVRSLQKIFPQSFRDLEPIASVIADYSAFVVAKDSEIQSFADAVEVFIANPRALKASGGSVRGGTDHFILARALELGGGQPQALTYVPYDGGGKAMAGLLTGETQILSTGLSEAIDMARAGEVRIIAVTAPERLAELPDHRPSLSKILISPSQTGADSSLLQV